MHACDDPSVETAEFLLAALEQVNDAVVIVNGDHHVSRFNAAAELMWGLDRDEVLGRDVSCLGLPDLQQIEMAFASPTTDADPPRRRPIT